MLLKLFVILFFYLIGEVISFFIGGFLPGSVIGMVLLFVALRTRLLSVTKVDSAAKALISNMVLFFLPPTVGIVTVLPILGENIIAITTTFMLSTMIVIVVVGLTQQWIGKL